LDARTQVGGRQGRTLAPEQVPDEHAGQRQADAEFIDDIGRERGRAGDRREDGLDGGSVTGAWAPTVLTNPATSSGPMPVDQTRPYTTDT